ncbi:MAG: NAD(P)/FAD-dependent oxidoreductase [Vampirovibrionales bacterium]
MMPSTFTPNDTIPLPTDAYTCDVLILGAGMAGLTAAHTLHAQGYSVMLVDKGRGVGGRLATRRIENQRFDHGAQYFTATHPAFQQAVAQWVQAGVVAPWFEQLSTLPASQTTYPNTPRYTGTLGMTALAKHLAEGLTIHTSTRIGSIQHTPEGWQATSLPLSAEQTPTQYTAKTLISTLPVPQWLELLEASNIPLDAATTATLNAITYAPSHAFMLQFAPDAELPPLGSDTHSHGGLKLTEHPTLSWIANNSQKPGLQGQANPCWTIHTTADFSAQQWETPYDTLYPQIVAALEAVFEYPLPTPTQWQAHRWKFALVTHTHPEPTLAMPFEPPCYLAGDAFGSQSKLQTAFLSGQAAAEAIALTLSLV